MCRSHTSDLADYLPIAYPALDASPALTRTGPEQPVAGIGDDP